MTNSGGDSESSKTTSLFSEMSICVEALGIDHGEWLRLPRIERKKLRLYSIVKNQRMKREMDQAKQRQEREQEKMKQKSKKSYMRG